MTLLRCGALFVALTCATLAAPPSPFELHAVVKDPGADVKEYVLARRDGSTETVLLNTAVLLDETAVTSATVTTNSQGFQVLLTLTKAAAKRFEEITTKGLGERIGMVVAGRLLSAPRVQEPIAGGTLAIGSRFTEKEANDLAAELSKSIKP